MTERAQEAARNAAGVAVQAGTTIASWAFVAGSRVIQAAADAAVSAATSETTQASISLVRQQAEGIPDAVRQKTVQGYVRAAVEEDAGRLSNFVQTAAKEQSAAIAAAAEAKEEELAAAALAAAADARDAAVLAAEQQASALSAAAQEQAAALSRTAAVEAEQLTQAATSCVRVSSQTSSGLPDGYSDSRTHPLARAGGSKGD